MYGVDKGPIYVLLSDDEQDSKDLRGVTEHFMPYNVTDREGKTKNIFEIYRKSVHRATYRAFNFYPDVKHKFETNDLEAPADDKPRIDQHQRRAIKSRNLETRS